MGLDFLNPNQTTRFNRSDRELDWQCLKSDHSSTINSNNQTVDYRYQHARVLNFSKHYIEFLHFTRENEIKIIYK